MTLSRAVVLNLVVHATSACDRRPQVTTGANRTVVVCRLLCLIAFRHSATNDGAFACKRGRHSAVYFLLALLCLFFVGPISSTSFVSHVTVQDVKLLLGAWPQDKSFLSLQADIKALARQQIEQQLQQTQQSRQKGKQRQQPSDVHCSSSNGATGPGAEGQIAAMLGGKQLHTPPSTDIGLRQASSTYTKRQGSDQKQGMNKIDQNQQQTPAAAAAVASSTQSASADLQSNTDTDGSQNMQVCVNKIVIEECEDSESEIDDLSLHAMGPTRTHTTNDNASAAAPAAQVSRSNAGAAKHMTSGVLRTRDGSPSALASATANGEVTGVQQPEDHSLDAAQQLSSHADVSNSLGSIPVWQSGQQESDATTAPATTPACAHAAEAAVSAKAASSGGTAGTAKKAGPVSVAAAAGLAVKRLAEELPLPKSAHEFERTCRMLQGAGANNNPAAAVKYVKALKPDRYREVFKSGLSVQLVSQVATALEHDVQHDASFAENALTQLSRVDRFALVVPMLKSDAKAAGAVRAVLNSLEAQGREVAQLRKLYMV